MHQLGCLGEIANRGNFDDRFEVADRELWPEKVCYYSIHFKESGKNLKWIKPQVHIEFPTICSQALSWPTVVTRAVLL